MAIDQTGIMALPEADQAAMPQISLDDSYDAVKSALQEVRPDAAADMDAVMQEMIQDIKELSDEELDAMIDVVQRMHDNPDQYPQLRAQLIADDQADEEDFPPEYDPEFLGVALSVLLEAKRSRSSPAMQGPQGFAKGGIANAAASLAKKGRYGDTMLAHITPREAKMLRKKGGSGTINPKTGLPEFFIKKLFKKIGNIVKKILRNPIGKIIGTIALAAVLGPVVGTTLAMPLASAGTTLMAGGNIKDALKSAAVAYIAGPSSPVSDYVGGTVGKLTGLTGTALQAATSGVVGTGVGLLTGQKFGDAVKSGFMSAAMTAGGAMLGGGPAAQQPAAPVQDLLPSAPTMAGTGTATPPTVTGGVQPVAAATATPGQGVGAPGLPETVAQGAIEPPVPTAGPTGELPAGIPPRPAGAAPTGTGAAAQGPAGTQPATGTSSLRQVPGAMDSASAIGSNLMSGEFGKAASAAKDLFFPSAPTNAEIMNSTEFNQFWTDANTRAASANAPRITAETALKMFKEANPQFNPGLMRTYGPAVLGGTALMGAMGGFKPQPLKLTPEQQRIADMFGGGPGSSADLMRRYPHLYYVQGLPGVQGPSPFADGGEVVQEFASGGSANVPLMQHAYRSYWESTQPGQSIDWAGGKLTRISATSAYYENPQTGEKIMLNPQMDLGMIASRSPSIANLWSQEFGLQMPKGTLGSPSDMAQAYKNYWEKGEKEIQWAGGTLTKSDDGKTAVWRGPKTGGVLGGVLGGTQEVITLTPDSNLEDIANRSPTIAAAWKAEYGYSPGGFSLGTQISSRPSTIGVEQAGAGVVGTAANPYIAPYQQAQEANKVALGQMPPPQMPAPQPQTPPPQPAGPSPFVVGPTEPPPQLFMDGGIAALMKGGYPRRNGQIDGPGTETSDSIPAMLSDGEFVMTARAVRGAGNGNRREGAKKMYKLMHQLERNASRG